MWLSKEVLKNGYVNKKKFNILLKSLNATNLILMYNSMCLVIKGRKIIIGKMEGLICANQSYSLIIATPYPGHTTKLDDINYK